MMEEEYPPANSKSIMLREPFVVLSTVMYCESNA